jgi:hypothetical protein
MTEKFVFKIDAESPDGQAVRCETKIQIACTSDMAVAIIANIFKTEKQLQKLFLDALLVSMSNEEISEKMSDEEYQKRFNDDVDF